MKAEKYFNSKRRLLDRATTVNGLINAFIVDYDDPVRAAEYGRLKREINKQFKGDFKKSKAYFHRLLNEFEHNFYSI